LHEKDHINFEILQKKIVEVMQQSYPGINPSISEWKGQEITDFQEELRIRVNANISEKWFYLHMKSPNPSMPRIDMLNILSKYAGYANWDEFVFKDGHKILILAQQPSDPKPVKMSRPGSGIAANRYFILVPLLAAVAILILSGLYSLFNTQEYRFTFVDANTHDPITSTLTEVILLPEDESPVHARVDSDGSFRIKTSDRKIRMVVKARYYQSDTIVRFVKKFNHEETLALRADDYSLMIHYLSTMKVDDWEKRRKHLKAMIDDGAVICQVSQGKQVPGMSLYNKEEFIDLMTMPSGSLKNIEILDSRVKNEKIVMLRFHILENKK
jgi:hypothetical protein